MQHNIRYSGLCNAPSDFSSEDGVMSTLVNLIPEDGELKPVMPPKKLCSVPQEYKLLAKHSIQAGGMKEHYIFYKSADKCLYYVDISDKSDLSDADMVLIGGVGDEPKVVVIGNTIISYSPSGQRFFLWKNNETNTDGVLSYEWKYLDLGDHLPEAKLTFSLYGGCNVNDGPFVEWKESDRKAFPETKINTNVSIASQVAAVINYIVATNKKRGLFTLPFFVRYAYRMYDGSTLTMHSAPIFMTPSERTAFVVESEDINPKAESNETNLVNDKDLYYHYMCGKLMCAIDKSTIDFDTYGDIISSIDIFVSAPIYTYDQAEFDDLDNNDNWRLEDNTPSSSYGVYYPLSIAEQKVSDSPEFTFLDSKWQEGTDVTVYDGLIYLEPFEFNDEEIGPTTAPDLKYKVVTGKDSNVYTFMTSNILKLPKGTYHVIKANNASVWTVNEYLGTLVIGEKTTVVYGNIDLCRMETFQENETDPVTYKWYSVSNGAEYEVKNPWLRKSDFKRTIYYKHDKWHIDMSGLKYRLPIPAMDEEKLEDSITSCGLFYLLKSIDYKEASEWYLENNGNKPKVIELDDDYLTSLTNKEVMTDDYLTHDIIGADIGYNYNARLYLASIYRKAFGGWNTLSQILPQGDSEFHVFYEMHDASGTYYVDSYENPVQQWFQGLFLFYPSTNCKRAIIRRTGIGLTEPYQYYQVEMEAHENLNGAYAFAWYNDDDDSYVTDPDAWWTKHASKTITEDPIPDVRWVLEPNKLYASNVENPFYFPVTNINTIGTGKIIGVASTTKALSQGQFGQYPMYAFTDSGIWALTLTSTGGIATVTPTTRDVALDNGRSIVQLDDAIAFTSDRGLMLLQGSDVSPLTDQIKGTWFDPATLYGWSQISKEIGVSDVTLVGLSEYLKNAYILYDYPRQRILLTNPTEVLSLEYSLTSKQWGMADLGSTISAVANSYPNCVIQTYDRGGLVNNSYILDVSQADSFAAKIPVFAVSRPITFGDPFTRKTVYDVISRGDNVAVLLYGSRDFKHWYYIGSSINRFLRGLGGSPYTSYRLALVGSLASGQRLTGASVDFKPKDINTLR